MSWHSLCVLLFRYAGVKLSIVSKVQCHLHSKGRECKFQNKAHRSFDPRNAFSPVQGPWVWWYKQYYSSTINWCWRYMRALMRILHCDSSSINTKDFWDGVRESLGICNNWRKTWWLCSRLWKGRVWTQLTVVDGTFGRWREFCTAIHNPPTQRISGMCLSITALGICNNWWKTWWLCSRLWKRRVPTQLTVVYGTFGPRREFCTAIHHPSTWKFPGRGRIADSLGVWVSQ